VVPSHQAAEQLAGELLGQQMHGAPLSCMETVPGTTADHAAMMGCRVHDGGATGQGTAEGTAQHASSSGGGHGSGQRGSDKDTDTPPHQQLHDMEGSFEGDGGGGGGGKNGKRPPLPRPEVNEACPRCASPDTKFCYFNNYNIKQPRFFCKARARCGCGAHALTAHTRPHPQPGPALTPHLPPLALRTHAHHRCTIRHTMGRGPYGVCRMSYRSYGTHTGLMRWGYPLEIIG
jgi:hypothetical protein